MATYLPAKLITPNAMGIGGPGIAAWRKQNTAGAGTFDVHRTLTVSAPTSPARNITIQQGPTAVDTATERILDTFALTANRIYTINWIVAVPNNNYFEGFYGGSFDPGNPAVGGSYGYTYA